ncbi:hypothetical protein [Nocardioides sp.]
MPFFFLKIFLPIFIGGTFAFGSIYGLVWTKTQPPSNNPASQQIITYGN